MVNAESKSPIQVIERMSCTSPQSETSVGALERELERIRRNGYAVDNEEAGLGVRCIGAGVRDDTGGLVAGLSVSAPAERMKSA